MAGCVWVMVVAGCVGWRHQGTGLSVPGAGEGQRKGLDWFTHVENVVDGQTTLI